MTGRTKIIILLFSISVVFRIIIFFPRFFPTSDAGEFATFVREISLNSGLIPSSNALYFPGSKYIYPPFLFLLTYYLDLPFNFFLHSSGFVYLYTLFFLAIAAGSLMNVLIYRKTAIENSNTSKIISFALTAFFGIDIYAMTWGGYPYILDTLFTVALFFTLDKVEWKKSDYFFAILLSILIPLTHDLTWFIVAPTVIVFILFNLIKKDHRKVIHSALVFLITMSFGLLWWLPRIKFLTGVLFLSQSSGYGFFSPVGAGSESVLLAVPYAVPVVALVILEFYISVRRRRFEKVDSFTIALGVSATGLLFLFHDQVLLARIILYSYTFLMVIVLKNLHLLQELKKPKFDSSSLKRISRAALIILLVIGIPSQFYFADISSNYYSSGGFQYDPALVSWASTHLVNGTVAAPEIGNYLSAIDGSHVIIYSGFLVGSDQIAQRNAVYDLIFSPDNLSTGQLVQNLDLKYLVIGNSYVNSTVNGYYLTFDNPHFKLMEKFQYYSVYRVIYP